MRAILKTVLAAGFVLLLSSAFSLHSASAPDALTPDGGRYYGPLVDGKFHGRGRIEWDNGARYNGDFARGFFSGQGRMRTPSGEIYEGQFRKGMMAGRGRLKTPDGATYLGQFRNDLYNGRGRYQSATGEVYEGDFKDGRYHGYGRLTTPEEKYEGEFKDGQFSGHGEIVYSEGRKYRGQWQRGRYHGQGRFEYPDGEAYDGEFTQGAFTGRGTHTTKDGTRHEGIFLKWRPHGAGRYTDTWGNVYEGNFVNGEPSGRVRVTAAKNAGSYEGELRRWRPHGQGVLRLPNGDVYQGGFADGVYDGEGTLTYAKPRDNAVTVQSGTWRYGSLVDPEAERRALVNVETALYNQRTLLDTALSSLAPRQPGKINLYVLAVAGDGSQEVFRREVQFVLQHFDDQFGTRLRSIGLINSRTTVASVPMATISSIRESLKNIAARMDKTQDVLFLFLTSHGSQEHELVLNQNNMRLRGLSAAELGDMLKESGIHWKVVVVSACYSGGFIDSIKDEYTMVITAARRDRRSFGCSDDNDFTYFGRAFFKEALPRSTSFHDAFHKAASLVREWEAVELKTSLSAAETELSLPQMSTTDAINQHLQRWWSQLRSSDLLVEKLKRPEKKLREEDSSPPDRTKE